MLKSTHTLADIRKHFPAAREESDHSITLPECPICATEGHQHKSVRLFRDASGRITGVSCSRFASAGTDANREHCAPIREQLGLAAPSRAFVSATLFTGDRQVTLEVERAGKAVQFVTARNCNGVLHNAELRLTKPDERATFATAIPGRDDAEREAIGRELVQLLDRFRKAQAATDDGAASEGNGKDSAATRLVRLAEETQLIHNADSDGYALMMVDGHKETWPLKSKGFKRWLQRRFYEQYEKAPGSQAVQDALGVIEGQAIYDGPERRLFIRIGERDGKIYLDLADERWRAVEIDADGWRIMDIPPVEFRRAKGMLPLPAPERGGSIEELRPFLYLDKGDLWTLMLGSLVMKFHPRGPYPVDVFVGGQGCAKTCRSRFIRSLVDPSSADTRNAPREIRDLQIAASNEWLPVFDNLSRIPDWLSDGFCCLSTGGGMRVRELYSDTDEAIFSTKRPLILTSITEIVERPDLLDRAVIFNLPVIEKIERIHEKLLWAQFEAARPRILGAVLDAVSCALRHEPSVVIREASRMADFERWAVAAEPALGLPPGAFLAAYQKNQNSANELALEASPITEPILGLVPTPGEWLGTARELFDLLLTAKSEDDKRKLKEQGWPKAPNGLSAMLRRLAPNLSAHGISIEFNLRTDKKGSRKIRIVRREKPESGNDDEKPPDLENGKEQAQDWVGKRSSVIVRSSDADASVDGSMNCASDDLFRFSDDPALSDDLWQSSDDLSPAQFPASDDPLPASDDLYLPSDDASDDLLHFDPSTQLIDSRIVAASSDDLTMTDDLLPTQSCRVRTVALDTETERFDERRGITPRNAKMIGLSLSYDGERADYVTDREAWPLMMPEQEQTVVMHNAKFDFGVLSRAGLPLPAKWEDSLIAAHLLRETGEHGLKPLAREHLGIDDPTTFEEADRMRLLDPEVFNEYAKNDARYTFRLWPLFRREMGRQGLATAYKLEKAVLPVVMAMESRGMLIDVAALRTAGEETAARLSCLEAQIYDYAGCLFNLRSPQKLAAILSAKLGMQLPTGEEGAPCVDKHALKDLAGQHPIIPPLLEYRELDKLASAFIAKLPERADADGRVHPTFNQLGATSGRFTCSNPNVQQMPRSSGLAALLRASFIAGPGRKLVCADWSQVELRVLAHFSQDDALIEAFLSGADLHTRTAARMFGKAESDIGKRERNIAKSINFGIAYGMGAPGLFRSLNAAGIVVNQADCADFIDTYNVSYPGVRRFLAAVGHKAQQQGFARTLSGRKRRLNADGSNMLSVKNAVIQGSSADIAKLAMTRIHRALPADAYLIAMIHDEVIIDCREEQAEEVLSTVRSVMELPPQDFRIPLVVDAQIGNNWGECK